MGAVRAKFCYSTGVASGNVYGTLPLEVQLPLVNLASGSGVSTVIPSNSFAADLMTIQWLLSLTWMVGRQFCEVTFLRSYTPQKNSATTLKHLSVTLFSRFMVDTLSSDARLALSGSSGRWLRWIVGEDCYFDYSCSVVGDKFYMKTLMRYDRSNTGWRWAPLVHSALL